jgi:hypothetical protein
LVDISRLHRVELGNIEVMIEEGDSPAARKQLTVSGLDYV